LISRYTTEPRFVAAEDEKGRQEDEGINGKWLEADARRVVACATRLQAALQGVLLCGPGQGSGQ
jgi:hypothetical protein